jgi:hypothetical protein
MILNSIGWGIMAWGLSQFFIAMLSASNYLHINFCSMNKNNQEVIEQVPFAIALSVFLITL